MSLKSLSKTRWKVEADRITIYPYGLSYILAAVVAILFAAGYYVYLTYLQNSVESSFPLLIILTAIIIFFIAWAGTSVEFDLNEGKMRKRLMGFLPLNSVPFSRIHSINPVSNQMGSYTYKVFKKDNRYGKGFQLSCSYSKNDDPNAIAFVDQVVAPIHHHLENYDSPQDFKAVEITQYEFFNVQGGTYALKKNRIGSMGLGLLLLFIGIHELTPAAWMGHDLSVGRICFLLFTLVGGPVIIMAGFTVVTLDRNTRLLSRTSPIGLGNKTYSFDHFNGIQTVRKSTNLIYSGTDVQLYFIKPDTHKEEAIVLQSFFSTKKVERFIAEVNSIILTR